MANDDEAAQQAAEAHLAACWAYLDAQDGGDEPDVPEPDLLGPFCGCLTCEVRETLHAAYPHLKRLWESEHQGPSC